MHQARTIARTAAAGAGELIASRRRVTGDVRSKSSATDLVTATDIDAGVRAVELILAADPNARFIIEEEEVFGLTDAQRGSLDSGPAWVIDPLDGTTSYVHDFPCFSVSIAYLEDGVPVAGAVHNVPLAQTVSASLGEGADADGTPVTCGYADSLGSALLVTGFPYDRGALLDTQLAILTAFLRSPVHGIRRDGSAAVDLCHVALGRADGFWEFGLKPWDMAAGVLICSEAGARVTGIVGEQWSTASTGVIAANPVLHEQMLRVVLEHSEG